MQLRRRSLWSVVFLLSVPLSGRAAEPDPLEAARAMVDAERKFYQTGQEQGTRAAFLAFLADDGIVFRPGPLNGKEVWGKRPETGFDLVWEPTFAAMSRSADFGYDTGPAKWRANKKEEKFSGHGQFVSIWKKQTDGSWKVALDLGVENAEPTGKPETLRTIVPGEPKGPVNFETAEKGRLETQQNLPRRPGPIRPSRHSSSPRPKYASIAKAIFLPSGKMRRARYSMRPPAG